MLLLAEDWSLEIDIQDDPRSVVHTRTLVGMFEPTAYGFMQHSTRIGARTLCQPVWPPLEVCLTSNRVSTSDVQHVSHDIGRRLNTWELDFRI